MQQGPGHSFEALNDDFEVQFFSRLHFYTLSKTLIAGWDMQLRYFCVVKTLLNNLPLMFAQLSLISSLRYLPICIVASDVFLMVRKRLSVTRILLQK